jgi:hypothetical protein
VSKTENSYRDVLSDDKSLATFLKNMGLFDEYFCTLMNEKRDFTLRLEVRGDKGKLVWCRVSRDHFDKLNGSS